MVSLAHTMRYFLNLAGIGLSNEDGQGLVEYVLILALIAIVIVGAAATGLTTNIGTAVTAIGAKLQPTP